MRKRIPGFLNFPFEDRLKHPNYFSKRPKDARARDRNELQKGFQMNDIDKVLVVREPEWTRSKGVKLDKCKFKRHEQELVYQQY